MKTLILYSLFCVSLFGAVWIKEIPQPLERAFIPTGFDNNDTIQVVARGSFKNSCYQMGYLQSMLDQDTLEITLTAMAYEYQGKCTDFKIPFHHVVHLGLIRQEGKYTLRDSVSGKVLGTLTVDKGVENNGGTDSELYPPLLDAYLSEGRKSLVLTGTAPTSCFKIDKVRFQPYEDVLVVQPIADYNGQGCEKGVYPFRKTVPISVALPRSPFLLHVRSSGGQSINKMIYLPGP